MPRPIRRGAERRRVRHTASTGFPRSPAPSSMPPTFGAQDMPGWPRETAHAMLLKSTDAMHVFDGHRPRDADRELRPDRVVLAEDLAAARITVPDFYAGDLLCPAGKTPLYLGQPVALLIWNDFARFAIAQADDALDARACCASAPKPARWRARPMQPLASSALPAQTPDAADVYSPMLAGWTFPLLYQKATVRVGRCRRRPAPMRSALRLRRADPGGDRRSRPRTARARSHASRPSRSTRSSSSRRPVSPGTTARRASSNS